MQAEALYSDWPMEVHICHLCVQLFIGHITVCDFHPVMAGILRNLLPGFLVVQTILNQLTIRILKAVRP